MRVLLFFPTLLLAFNLIGQNICTNGMISDHPTGCIPCNYDLEIIVPGGRITSNRTDIIYYNTDEFTPDSIAYDFPCGTVDRSAWFTYFANNDGAVAFPFPKILV